MVGLPLPMLAQPPIDDVPITQRPRFTNLGLEEVDNTVNSAEALNLDLPSAPDAALECNQHNLKEERLPSEETWLGTASDSLNTNNMLDSDSDINDSCYEINDRGSAMPFRRRWTEPASTPGCSGFVRQRTEELNSLDPDPLFPPLSEHLDTASGDNSSSHIIRSISEGSPAGRPGFVRQMSMELENVARAK